MKIYDISQTLDQNTEWPGDTAYERNQVLAIDDGYSCNVSYIKSSLHNGTHTDSHKHYSNQGSSIDQHKLDPYIGSCQVVHVMHAKDRLIGITDLKVPITEKRVLFRTKQTTHPEIWDNNFRGISPSLVAYLSDCGVVLIGTDAPSFDVFESKSLESHHKLLEHDIYNLENLRLDSIEVGVYNLIALPLKIKGADASPVRAILTREAK